MSCDHGYVNPSDCPDCPAQREYDLVAQIVDAIEENTKAITRMADAVEAFTAKMFEERSR